MREQGIRTKFNPLDEVEGQRLVVVDDSIVRGNTTRQLVQMLFDAGAAEVHVRVSSPPIVSPCFYGIDTADEDELAAAHRSVEEMRELDRCDLALLPLARRHAGGDDAAGGLGLPRLLHARVPDARAAEGREAPLRARAGLTDTARLAVLPVSVSSGTIGRWRMRRRRRLMLEALFDIRAMISDIHAVVMRIVEDDDGEEEEEEDT